MRRRAFLASVGITAFAGCSTDGGSTGNGPTGTPTTTSTSSGEPNFELQNAEIPDTKPLNDPLKIAIAVQNTGSRSETFSSALEWKINGGEWQTLTEVEMPLAAGETGEWRSPEFTLQYLRTIHFQLAAFDKTWSLQVIPKQLDFSDPYTVPTGLILNVLGGLFEPEYPTPSDETDETVTPTAAPEGEMWAVIRLQIRNRLNKPQTMPAADEFVLTVDGERRPQHQEVSDNPYKSSDLEGQGSLRADLVYAVPEGTQGNDITVTWESSLPDGDVKAIWTT